MHKFIDVLLPIAVDRPFTYAIENDQSKLIEPGFRVAVSFGKSKIYTGVVLKIHNIPPQGYDAKFIELVLDKQKSITKKQLDFWLWILDFWLLNSIFRGFGFLIWISNPTISTQIFRFQSDDESKFSLPC